MSFFGIVAIGASAGGVEAIISVLADLPEDFPVPIVVVLHIGPTDKSLLAEILQWNCRLKVRDAHEGDALARGVVYVAPPDRHTLIKNRKIALDTSAPKHFVRPSIDILFNSVAECFGDRAIGVILTGTGKDGSEGLSYIKSLGGVTIAQDEHTSESFGMPGAAIELGAVNFILPIQDIGHIILMLTAIPEE